MIMSSRYTRQMSRLSSLITKSINRWKVAGAPINPKGITRNGKVPFRVTNMILSRLSSSIIT